jgi:pimeloyl-ACP methyl ester carboxylesterase
MRTPITVPVLQLHGAHDPVVLPRTALEPVEAVTGRFERHLVPDAGHFLPEEAPDVVTAHLLDWLGGLPD